MKKIIYLAIAVMALSACAPDSWIPNAPGGYAGGGSGSGSGSGSGAGGGSEAGPSGKYSGKTYTWKDIDAKLRGGWISAYKYEEWSYQYRLQYTGNELYHAHDHSDGTRQGMWYRTGENITFGDIVQSGDHQVAFFTYSGDEYQYSTSSGAPSGWLCGSQRFAVQYRLHVQELVEYNRLFLNDDDMEHPYKKANIFISTDPYEEYWVGE